MTLIDAIGDRIDLSQVGDRSSLRDQLARLTNAEASDLLSQIKRLLPKPSNAPSAFRFVANSTLSGFPYPCGQFECRTQRLAEISAFAALYADEIVLFNPMSWFSTHQLKPKTANLDSKALEEFSFRLSQIIALHPLIERKIVTFVDMTTHNYCQNCFQKGLNIANSLTHDESTEEDNDPYFQIANYYIDLVDVSFEGIRDNVAYFRIEGDKDFIGHETAFYSCSADLARGLKKGKKLNIDQVLRVGVSRSFAHYHSNDISKAHSISNLYGIDKMISSAFQFNILKDYFGEEKFGQIINVDYPFISGLELNKVVKFRDNEWHHLHDFRKLIENGLRSGVDVAEELQSESISIEKMISKRSRVFRRDVAKDFSISVAGIGASVLASGVSNTVAIVLGALTSGHLAKMAIPKIIDRIAEPDDIRDSKVYYAWKVTNKILRK
ncbi:hypothetical protein [Bauldia litoralis]|uniref:hypothetical protein n=1 Tax=Bauldia litoralis TaxID=665467 RepID=UPI001114474C|nr:hypothetical protein [Bauldia litoralis]